MFLQWTIDNIKSKMDVILALDNNKRLFKGFNSWLFTVGYTPQEIDYITNNDLVLNAMKL